MSQNCVICATTGLPKPSNKISIYRIYQYFNYRVQLDLTYFKIGNTKCFVMHAVDTATRYSETGILVNQKLPT